MSQHMENTQHPNKKQKTGDKNNDTTGILFLDRVGAQLVVVSNGKAIARHSVQKPIELREKQREMSTLKFASFKLKFIREYYNQIAEATARIFMDGFNPVISNLIVCGPDESHKAFINKGVISMTLQQCISEVRYTNTDLNEDPLGKFIVLEYITFEK